MTLDKDQQSPPTEETQQLNESEMSAVVGGYDAGDIDKPGTEADGVVRVIPK